MQFALTGHTLVHVPLSPDRHSRGGRPRRPRGPYARLFDAPGALAFTLPNLLARLPMGMFSISAVLLITGLHGSYALAGAVVAATLAASAVGGPLLARLVDRYGQARITVPAVLLTGTGHLGLLWCVTGGAPLWAWFCCVPLMAATPNTGGMSRARWAHLYRGDPAARHTANSFEQAMDELCFLLGPLIAAGLCTALFPAAGTLTAVALLVTGGVLFAAQRRTEPPVAPRGPGRARTGRAPLLLPGIPPLLVTFLCTGAVFGSLEVVTIAYADGLGLKAWAGAVLAAQALGSGAAGLAFGLLAPGAAPVRRRLVRWVTLMAVLMALPLLVAAATGALLPLVPALLIAGMATAPAMVTGMTLLQELTPAPRLNEGMSLAVTALLSGIAAGAAAGGWAADHLPPGAAGYVTPLTAAALAAAVASLAFYSWKPVRKSTATGPAVAPPEPPSSSSTAKARSASPR
jgi:predicted MFS family arabinose efflux permease